VSAFNCCCQLINFNCPQLATECSGKYEQPEGLELFYAKPSLAFKLIFRRPRSEVVCIFMGPVNSIRNDILCIATQMKTVRLNYGRRGTQMLHIWRRQGKYFQVASGLPKLTLLSHRSLHHHHHKTHTCCSYVPAESNALSRNFIHKDFIPSRFCPVSKRPQGVGLDRQK